MSNLEFVGDRHIYYLDGEQIPCVSDLCRFIVREVYKDTPDWQLGAAADRGTKVHAAAEILDKSGSAEIEEEYAPYLEAYASFLREHDVNWELIEHAGFHPGFLYAGTIDRYGLLDGERTLVDIKTTCTVHKPLCVATLNLYRLILEANGCMVDQMAILHLRKTGKYKIIKFDPDNDIPYALLILQKLTNRRKRGAKNG